MGEQVIVKGITKHTVLLVVEQQKRAVGMKAILERLGCRVLVADKFFDAVNVVAQEMPHLVISDAQLSDGSAANLYDRLIAHPILNKTPILVRVPKKTRELIEPLVGKKFAGIILGAFEPKTFLVKVQKALNDYSKVSPFYVSAENIAIEKTLAVSVGAMVMGRHGEFIVAKSATEVDQNASVKCVPQESQKYGAVVFRRGSNMKQKEGIYNLFPLDRAHGRGKTWLSKLPEIELPNDTSKKGQVAKKKTDGKTVLFFDPSADRFEQFKQILEGYQYKLLHAPSIQDAARILQMNMDMVGAIYLHELGAGSGAIAFKEAYNGIGEADRPPMIVGTTSVHARSSGKVGYLKRPFGLGTFVEMLEACFVHCNEDLKAGASRVQNAGVKVNYTSTVSLVGLDETGGIFQLRYPLVKGSKIKIENKELIDILSGDENVRIVSVGTSPETPDVWQARFEVLNAGASKTTYWEKVQKAIGEVAPPPEPPAEP